MRAGVWGEFLGRPDRFSVWVQVNGRRELAHLPNPGRLAEVLVPGRPILLRPAQGRKTRWTAVGADLGAFLVSLDSTLPNRAFPRLLAEGWLPDFRGLEILAREPALGRGRADFLLAGPAGRVWVEVKSVTLVENGVALFPDSPTPRGTRHLRELQRIAKGPEKAFVVFVVQRPDAERFGPNAAVDPEFAKAFWEAVAAGVVPRALVCGFDGEDLRPRRLLGWESLVVPCGLPPVFPARTIASGGDSHEQSGEEGREP